MSTGTAIEWTEVTWNPTTGCDRISPGCDHCYALTLAKRLKAMGQAKYQRDGDLRTSGPGFGVTVHEKALFEPLRWRRPRKVFVNSMSDIGCPALSRVSRMCWARGCRSARISDQLTRGLPVTVTEHAGWSL
ncbi:DUF5131 family protein [Streptomyces canus]|uniref:DUF5131 family protein n=1 Tax=Streptomyces canus TaxID=58343 RepID=UPI002E33D1DE|nr:DUF5131 family protein [Streptomyces canus]